MDLAFSIADVIVSRAGAGTISELCMVGKPVILIPSPNVAEDHQTMNAMALVKKNAALMVEDINAPNSLIPLVFDLMKDINRQKEISANILKLALPNAAQEIAAKVLEIVEKME